VPEPEPTQPPGRPAAHRPGPWWASWGPGLLLGCLVLGPGLRGGSLLSLDLLVTPDIPIPNGIYGLGPALTQRVPSFALLGVLSWLVGGPVAAKAVIVALVAAGYVGAGRLVRPRGDRVAEVAAGVLWAAGPFALTRIGAGHLNVLWVIGVLPWALPRLARPSAVPRATFLASLLVAFGGPAAGTLGLTVLAFGLVSEPRGERAPVRAVAAGALANLVWVLPTVVVLWAGARVSEAGDFATHVSGVAGWPSLLVGGGFWQFEYQVGAQGAVGALAGVALAALAWVGRRDLDPRWARPAGWAAVVGLALAVASAVPGVDGAYRWLSLLPFGAPLRESQRFLALWLLWAAPAAALGAARVARSAAARFGGAGREPVTAPGRHGPAGRPRSPGRGVAQAAAVVPLVLVVALSAPGWWGIEGRLEPVRFPAGWATARRLVRSEPGPVVALPWSEYPPLSFAGGRQVFNPLPDYLGGDVISSYDPAFRPEEQSQEQVDGRALVVDRLSDRALAGHPIGARLDDLGVRWVVLVKQGGWERYRALADDPRLRLEADDDDVQVYAVEGWDGPATSPDGRPHRLSRPVPPVLRTDAPRGSVLDVAGAPGWIQGWGTPVRVTRDGRLRLEGDGGTLWFWPAALLLAFDALLAAAAGAALATARRPRPPTGGAAAREPDTSVHPEPDLSGGSADGAHRSG
jgi:hypothetical protein